MNQEQKIQEVIRYIQDANPKAEFIEGHDNAILGIATVPQLYS